MFSVVGSLDDLIKVYVVRGIVFVEGQDCPYPVEVDGLDHQALHILGQVDGEPMAAGRIRFIDGWAKLERIAVRERFRGHKSGKKLVEYMLEQARERGFFCYKMHAQAYLQKFYSDLGFQTKGELFIEAGIEHYLMIREDK